MTSKDEIGKQRVQSVHRDARPVAWDDGNGGVGGYEIWSNSDTKCLGEGRFEEAAWQNAAESLPAQPEQELCPYCRETKDKCLSNEYCYSTHWEVAPVEAKEKERCTSCNAILPHKRFSRCWKSRVAEPKPTPSTQSNETFEDVRRSLSAAHNLINNWHDINYGTRAVEAQDIICEAITSIMRLESPKPQPDSSSISTEQTFRSDEALLRDILFYCRSRPDNHPKFDMAIREACIKLQGFDPNINAAKGQSNGR